VTNKREERGRVLKMEIEIGIEIDKSISKQD
jgi:hypothetical protein